MCGTGRDSKGKQQAVPAIKDDSNYEQLQSEEEEEAKEEESAAQRFQHMQRNKKLAKKKANRAKAAAALVHRAQNDFLGRIPDGLEVNVWGPLDVKRLNSGFRGARTPDPNVPFDLDQIARYALIFGRPGMENTWQGITVDFAYRMHWQTLFGFALCRALCANSARKTILVRRIALVMARPGLYCEAIDAFNKVYDEPFAPQYGPQLTITQVHVLDDKVQNFSDNDAIHVLLYNHIPLEWVDHAYIYGVVYLEQQFHHPMMSLDIFWEVDNEHLEHLKLYGTPAAIPQWDGWRELTEEDHYCLMFKQAEESVAGLFPEADGFYYYIGMDLDPNVGQLWKQTPAHGTMPSIRAATNIALTDCEMIDVTAAGGPTTPPITESEPLSATTNIAIEESAKTTEAGGSQPGKKTG
ncbi:hypothetical protein C0992_004026 [Termitomyces sp. T32_za158]|nr:hypothetical protein C0992_004026 [Termitomyces sp. T32_za158]